MLAGPADSIASRMIRPATSSAVFHDVSVRPDSVRTIGLPSR